MKRTHSITHSIRTSIAGRRNGRPYRLCALRCIAGAFLVIAPVALRAQSPAASGTVLTIAGKGLHGFSGDGGPATNAMIGGVNGLAVGPDGTLYFADTSNNRIRAVDPASGIVRTIAGTGIRGESGNNGPATNAAIGHVISLAADRSRNALYVPEWDNNWVRKVNLTNGLLTVYAGTGVFGMGFEGDGGPATAAYLNLPETVALDAAGKLFIGDVFNQRIRQVDPVTGFISTTAGNGSYGFSGDGGPATNASFSDLLGVAADSLGNVFALDQDSSQRVRRVDALTGIITTIAGGGTNTLGTGLATNMNFTDFQDMAANNVGELYLSGFFRVFKLNLVSGLIAPYAGDGIGGSFGGDGGSATNAVFGQIVALAVPPGGGLIIADAGHDRIRYVVPDSINLSNDSGQTAFYLPWVSALAGDLTVVNNPNLTNINMGSLTTVNGSLDISGNTSATNIDMAALVTSAGELNISENISVGGLDLGSLLSAGEFIISNNPSAAVINMAALVTTAGELNISGNISVGGLDLGSLLSAGELIISNNPSAAVINMAALVTTAGELNISGNTSAAALSLGSLTEVGGHLRIANNPSLTNVILIALTNVAGHVEITGNDNARIVDLNSISAVTGSVMISNNPSAQAIALGAVETIGGTVSVNDNATAASVDLSHLLAAGSVEINGNTTATNLDLGSVSGVTGSVVISDNPSALTMALGALETVGGMVSINDNAAAGSVDLSGLHTAGSVVISGNTSATSVDLSSVSGVTGSVAVSGNSSVQTLDLGSITSVPGNITIESNAPGTVVDLNNLTVYGCGTNQVTMTLDASTVHLTNGLTLCTNGTLVGSSTVDGSITNNGTIEPGASPGSFNIAGSLVLLPGSRLRFELGGPAAGSQYDQLNISNAVTYGGTVTVQLINGFTPSAGQVFQLINAPSRFGAFAGASLPALPAGLSWINRLAADGSIGVVGQAVAPQLLNPLVLGNGSFKFGFSNPAGASFTVLTATNAALPLSNWTALGPPTELSPGQYQFTDLQNTNDAHRFYRVRQP